jgi:hypothetical protein
MLFKSSLINQEMNISVCFSSPLLAFFAANRYIIALGLINYASVFFHKIAFFANFFFLLHSHSEIKSRKLIFRWKLSIFKLNIKKGVEMLLYSLSSVQKLQSTSHHSNCYCAVLISTFSSDEHHVK